MKIRKLYICAAVITAGFFLSSCNTPFLSGLSPARDISGTWTTPIAGTLYFLDDDGSRKGTVTTKISIKVITQGVGHNGITLGNGKFDASISFDVVSTSGIIPLYFYDNPSWFVIAQLSATVVQNSDPTSSFSANMDGTSITTDSMMFRFSETWFGLSTDGEYIILKKQY